MLMEMPQIHLLDYNMEDFYKKQLSKFRSTRPFSPFQNNPKI